MMMKEGEYAQHISLPLWDENSISVDTMRGLPIYELSSGGIPDAASEMANTERREIEKWGKRMGVSTRTAKYLEKGDVSDKTSRCRGFFIWEK